MQKNSDKDNNSQQFKYSLVKIWSKQMSISKNIGIKPARDAIKFQERGKNCLFGMSYIEMSRDFKIPSN